MSDITENDRLNAKLLEKEQVIANLREQLAKLEGRLGRSPEAPTKIELQDQIREAISTAEDLMGSPPPHGAGRRHTEANRALDRLVDRLYAEPGATLSRSAGMRCPICCAKAGEPHLAGYPCATPPA